MCLVDVIVRRDVCEGNIFSKDLDMLLCLSLIKDPKCTLKLAGEHSV